MARYDRKKPSCMDFAAHRKTTVTMQLQFFQNGVTEDISDFTVYFTAKENMSDTDANAVVDKKLVEADFSDVANGKAIITLSPTETDLTPGRYWYSIAYKDDDDNVEVVFSGKMTIIKSVRITKD